MNKAKKILKKNLYNEKVVVAVSGGPDSMALLYLVNNLKHQLKLEIICAHVNHKLRQESDDEQIMVEEFCKKNDIIFELLTITDYKKDNFHNDARKQRYNFFEKCVKKCQAKHLLTAHHGDDLMETILMRIARGSSLKGYAGFSSKKQKDNYIILRPLINYTKQEILDFVKTNNIPYAIDKSNEKNIYTRNRFRKYILPPLKNENKNIHDKFYKFNKTLEMYDNYINKATDKHFKKIYNGELDLIKLKKLDKLIIIKIIQKLLYKHYQDNLKEINDKHINSIYKMIMSNKPNMKINLPLDKIAIKSYEKLSIINNEIVEDYIYELKKTIILPNGKTIEKIENTQNDSNNICRLNSNELKLPLYIRNRKPGDKITVKGLNGTQKVKDIFIDKKISARERKQWPIVVDSAENIVWLPGLKKTKFNKQKEENCDIILRYF